MEEDHLEELVRSIFLKMKGKVKDVLFFEDNGERMIQVVFKEPDAIQNISPIFMESQDRVFIDVDNNLIETNRDFLESAFFTMITMSVLQQIKNPMGGENN